MTATKDDFNYPIKYCDQCGHAIEQRWESDTPELQQITTLVDSLFLVEGDIASSTTPSGIIAQSYAVGVRRSYKDSPPIASLAKLVFDRFTYAFDDKQTGRHFWWRERPNVIMQTELLTRRTNYALWFSCAIEDLTEVEMKKLGYILEDAAAV